MSEVLTLPTERENIALRQLTIADAPVYFEAVRANKEHLSQFGDDTYKKYPTLESVEESIIHPKDPNKIRMGIWDDGLFVGTVNLTPDEDGKAAEIGYWTDGRRLRKGYASLAARALSQYGLERFGKVYAKVTTEETETGERANEKSVGVLEKVGFKQIAKETGRLIFELANSETDKDTVEVEVASTKDLEELTEFMQPVYADTYPNDRGIKREMFENNTFRDHLRSYLAEKLANPSVTLLKALRDHEIVGTIGIEYDPADPTSGEVWGFYVKPGLQDQGYGSQLWSELMGDSRVKGLNKLTLTVAKDSTKAIAFYEKNGFTKVGEEDWDWPHWAEEHPHNQYWLMEKQL